MKVTPVSVQLFLPPPPAPRSKGVHVSNIIRCMASDMGILKQWWAEELELTDINEITDPVAMLRICIGLAWESWYIPQILSQYGVVKHPGEMKVDHVYMTPDGESVDVIITQSGKGHVLR